MFFMSYFEYLFLSLLYFLVKSKFKRRGINLSQISFFNKSLILWIFTLSMIEYLFILTMISLTIASEYYGLTANNWIIYRLVCTLDSDIFPFINLVIGLNLLYLFYYQAVITHNKRN